MSPVRRMTTETEDKPAELGWADLVTHDGLFAINAEQRIVYWNDGAESILGYTASDVVGKPCYEVMRGRDSRNYLFCRRNCPILTNARKGRSSLDYDILCHLPNGQGKWVNVSVAIRKGRRTLEVVHMFRDVTHHRRTEEFARKAGAALRQLLDEDGDHVEDRPQGAAPPLPQISRREMEVLRLLASGMTTAQVAEALTIRPITARNHITRLLTRLGVASRLQAVVYAYQHGMI